MIRTMVYLDDNQPRLIEVISKATKKSQSQIIREALDHGLKHIYTKKNSGVEGLLALVELGKKLKIKAPADLSSRLDDYLYGDKE